MALRVGSKETSDCTSAAKQPPSTLRRKVQGLSKTCLCRGIAYGIQLVKDRWSAWRWGSQTRKIESVVIDTLSTSPGTESASVGKTISLDFTDPDQIKNALREVFIRGDKEACKQLAMIPQDIQHPEFFYELFELGIQHKFKIGLEALEKQWHSSYMQLPLRGEGSLMELLISAINSNDEEPINILKKHPRFLELNKEDMYAVLSFATNQSIPMGILALSNHPTAQHLNHEDFLKIITRLQEDDLPCCTALVALPGWQKMSSDEVKNLIEECISNRWENLFLQASRHPRWKEVSVEGIVEVTKMAVCSGEWKPLLERLERHSAWSKINQEQLAKIAEKAICECCYDDGWMDERDGILWIPSESPRSFTARSIISRLQLHPEWKHLSEGHIEKLLVSQKNPEFGWIYEISIGHPSWDKLSLEQLKKVTLHVIEYNYSEVIIMKLMDHPLWKQMSEQDLQDMLSESLKREDAQEVFNLLKTHPERKNLSGDSIRRLLWNATDPQCG